MISTKKQNKTKQNKKPWKCQNVRLAKNRKSKRKITHTHTHTYAIKTLKGASIFQQVHDVEQDKVTLAQVRETLHSIYEDIRQLATLTRLKNKILRKKDERQNPQGYTDMVDADRWWQFLEEDVGILQLEAEKSKKRAKQAKQLKKREMYNANTG